VFSLGIRKITGKPNPNIIAMAMIKKASSGCLLIKSGKF
jgi:hypothetical protein